MIGPSACRQGVIGWISQGLGKVVPQPDDKYKEGSQTNEDQTEVRLFYYTITLSIRQQHSILNNISPATAVICFTFLIFETPDVF